jgi:conjugative relaxase-like TrwC/TraI family protein
MFTVAVQRDLSRAQEYFDEHLSVNEYYTAEDLRPTQWIGLGTQRLGLQAGQPVTRAAFRALCENAHPETGQRLTQRQNEKGKRRIFYDFVCSPPKSVSILAVCLNDQRLVTAHEEAAQVALRELENFASTRVRRSSPHQDRQTGNLIAAQFTHTTSRSLDPQLHTHFTVFNATYDSTEQRWKALQAGAMYDATRYATEVYRNELARRVRALGYRTERAEIAWEIEGVSKEVRDRFSKRSAIRDALVREVEQRLGRKLTKNEISNVVHWSREKKIKGISAAEVRSRHQAELSEGELYSLSQLCRSATSPRFASRAGDEKLAIDFAVSHAFERQSVVSEHELLKVALARRPGDLELPKLKEALRRCPEIILVKASHS